MLPNPFEELLRDFQAAYAEYGRELFFLSALTRDEWNADREQIDKIAGCLGYIPLEEEGKDGAPGYYIFGPLYRNRCGRRTERWEEPFERFEELAAKAGASLPLAARQRIPFEPAEPVMWWLAYMWWEKPPSKDDLIPPDGVTKKTRVIWPEPFLQSAEVIERGGLCASTEDGPGDPPKAVHNADFTMVDWYGTEYTFALGVQSSAVKALWEEWETTGLGLHQDTIREAIDPERDTFRMDTAFRNHPAFGTIIQRCGDGRYKLAPPRVEPPAPSPSSKKKKR